MPIVTNAKELGEAMSGQKYPIQVRSKELVECIERLRSLSRLVWIPVLASLGTVLVVFGGPQVGLLVVFPGAREAAGLLAPAGDYVLAASEFDFS